MYLPSMGEPTDERDKEAVRDGIWEQNGKNPLTAALIALTVIGVTYYYAQAVMTFIGTLITMGGSNTESGGSTFIERMSAMVSVSKQPLRISLLVSQILFMLLPTLWITQKWHSTEVRKYLRITPAPLSEIVLAVSITLLFLPAGNFINTFLITQLQMPDFMISINEQIFSSYSVKEFLFLTLVVCITPAVCEEIFFRGLVQGTMERRLGAQSIIIVGLIFGLFHVQPIGLISLSLLGILFGYFFHRSRSMLPNVAAHFANNFAAIVFMAKAADGTPAFGTFISDMGIIGVLMTIPPMFLLLRYYHYRTESAHSTNQ